MKKETGVSEADICKRLMDFGFHAPTQAFPVGGTILIEPTESESVVEIDRFCDAMIQIKKEADMIGSGKWDKKNNVIKNAPHTAEALINGVHGADYPSKQAAYPLPYVKERGKYWPTCRRVNDLYGDRNIEVCSYTSQTFHD